MTLSTRYIVDLSRDQQIQNEDSKIMDYGLETRLSPSRVESRFTEYRVGTSLTRIISVGTLGYPSRALSS